MGRVYYGQSGYVGCRMSENAVLAYNHGEKPKSKWTKKAMVAAVEGYCAEEELPCDRGKLTALRKDDMFTQLFEWKSWHHTGKYANETDFYGLNEEAVYNFFGVVA